MLRAFAARQGTWVLRCTTRNFTVRVARPAPQVLGFYVPLHTRKGEKHVFNTTKNNRRYQTLDKLVLGFGH